ncbi:MAG: hypothetical protein ACJAZF_004348, partial [Granulosicoccus sp.]
MSPTKTLTSARVRLRTWAKIFSNNKFSKNQAMRNSGST